MAAAKKHKPSRLVFLTDPELRELEQLEDGQLSAHFHELGTSRAAEVVRAVLRSYRITARVANAAWGLAQALNAHGIPMHLPQPVFDELTKLQAALSDYSPGNWPPPRKELEHTAHVLEQLYEEVTRRPSWESSLEAVYKAVEDAYKEIS